MKRHLLKQYEGPEVYNLKVRTWCGLLFKILTTRYTRDPTKATCQTCKKLFSRWRSDDKTSKARL